MNELTETELKSATVPGQSSCPACSGTASESVGMPALGFNDRHGDRIFVQPPYSILRCLECDLYFKSRTLPLDQLDDLYAAMESATFEHDGDFPTDHILQAALARLPRGSRVLDFGCSTGRVLRPFASTLACLGVEPNAQAAAVARSRGIQVQPFDQLRERYAGSIDAIVVSDVYEHLPHPLAPMAELAALLKPGGWLAIVTGNADAIASREFVGEFWYFRLASHLHMLSERHLAWLAGHIGLEVSRLRRCCHYEIPAAERLQQHVRAFAYRTFRLAPESTMASVIRRLPGLERAARWPTAPALNCESDHVVAFLTRPESTP